MSDTTRPGRRGGTTWWISGLFILLVAVAGVWLLVAPKTPPQPAPVPSAPTTPARMGPCPASAADPLSAGMSLRAAPAKTQWTPTKVAALPSVAGQGPSVVDSDGYRRCFAQTLIGATLAAATYSAQFADPTLWEKAVREGTVPQPDTESQIAVLKQQGGSNSARATYMVTGLTSVQATSPTTVVVGLVVVYDGSPSVSQFTMLWDGNDWRVRPSIESGGSIDDYMVWSR